MKSAEEIRAEARRLREAAENLQDPVLKRELAARALDLSVQAEAIARSNEAPEILRMNIARYRSMLATGIEDKQQKHLVQEMLGDAEEMLERLRKIPQP